MKIMSTYIFIINLYENKSGHYKYIYFNIKLYENKSGHYCNLGNDWSHWTLTAFPYVNWKKYRYIKFCKNLHIK
jgi:hypothetical protein